MQRGELENIRAELRGVTTLLLAAVGRTRGETGVTLSANHLFAVVFGGKDLQRRLNDASTETVNVHDK